MNYLLFHIYNSEALTVCLNGGETRGNVFPFSLNTDKISRKNTIYTIYAVNTTEK